MISKVTIESLFDSATPTILEIKDRLFILTGDNGAGKTTILNMTYYALNGNFEWFFKTNFKCIRLEFKKNNLKLKSLELNRKNNEIQVDYGFVSKKNKIRLNKNGSNIEIFVDEKKDDLGTYKKKELNIVSKSRKAVLYLKDENDGVELYESMDELIETNSIFDFINEIRKSLLYFPTYRRIDNDIKNLLQNNISKNFRFYRELDFLDNPIKFSQDRRVIGVGDEDIERIYRDYSESLREFNSEGLNKLLKEFVRSVIQSLYLNDEINNNKIDDLKMLEQAPQHLLDLADKLDIESIDHDKVFMHYTRKKENREKLASIMKDKKINFNIEVKPKTDMKDIVLENVIGDFLFDIGNQNSIVNELIQLYMDHLNAQEKKLEPYNYLKSGFNLFFKNKLGIELNLNNYNLSLTKPFEKLSTGEKQLITIISYSVLAINKSVFDPLIIIDEPEISLHVSWQGKLLGHLMNNNSTNFLLATHSPFIAKMDYFEYIHQLGDIDGDY